MPLLSATRVRSWSRLGPDAVSGGEGGAEIVHTAKVFDRVIIGLLHEAMIDHREDDPSEVVGAGDVPPPQDCRRQQAPLIQGKVAQTFAQLLAGDVAIRLRVVGDMNPFDRKPKPLLDKLERVGGINAKRVDHFLKALGMFVFFSRRHGLNVIKTVSN